ncbi:MAG: xanthine dehydrogenase family protein molybdopterin-binding subunit [Alphaproteobacteria bacterium]|nr:xanthine dehydrogenase family protein molybdopterin-binding subunit [Alphaproteobacteria bacterium]
MTTPSISNALSLAASRRTFLQGAGAAVGGFILGSFVPFGKHALAAGKPVAGVFDPNVFLKIGADNLVTVITKHFEMGQGVTTGLATLVAEELDADWSQMRYEFAPANPKLYNNLFFGPNQATGASTSIANSWEQMRKVGAAARLMFVAAAAARWNVPAEDIVVAKGIVRHRGSARQATLGELAVEAMAVDVPQKVNLKPASEWRLIGTRLPRLDSAAKTAGTAVYASDVRRPDMLTAVVRRPDQFGATVASFDASEATKIPGVVDVVQIHSGVAVLARDTWSALRGRDALKVTWDTRAAETRSTAEILTEYRALTKTQGLTALSRGDAAAGLASAARTLEAEFTFPFLAHAPMEPLNGIMEFRGDSAEIWSGCQLQSIDQRMAARVLGLKPEQVKINTFLAGGSFGRRGSAVGDWTIELATLAKAINGRAPVQIVWTREDDIKGGFYRPMLLHKATAGLDARGRISGWQHKVVSKRIFVGTPFERVFLKDGVDRSTIDGLNDIAYDLANYSVEVHNAPSPVPLLWWRSVGHSHTAHVIETVIDELAHLARRDPVAFRLDLLAQHPRDAAVLRLAAEKAGWGETLPPGRGRGVAVHQSFKTRVAMVADVSVEGSAVRVDRIVAAVDCGVAVNPDIVVAQVEGAVGFALSSVLRNQITLTDGVVDQGNFDDYEPTRMSEMPKVEVHIVKSDAAPTGIGEPGLPPLAPAIGNAIFAATGTRLRSLPLAAEA